MTELPEKCQCESSGFCRLLRRVDDPPQGRFMCPVRHKECQAKPHYFEMFLGESVYGGNTAPRPKRIKLHGKSQGLGDTIAWLLSRVLGIEKRAGCKCNQRQKTLNWLVPYDQTIWLFPIRLAVWFGRKLKPGARGG